MEPGKAVMKPLLIKKAPVKVLPADRATRADPVVILIQKIIPVAAEAIAVFALPADYRVVAWQEYSNTRTTLMKTQKCM